MLARVVGGSRASVASVILASVALLLQPLALRLAVAEDLPELLLHCEGSMSAVLEASPPVTRNNSFSVNLRLKDGAITDTGTGIVEGTGCTLADDVIKCEVTREYPLTRFNAVVKRSSSVVLNRKTGAVTLLLESWDYPANSDTHTAHMRALRTGTCRSNAMF